MAHLLRVVGYERDSIENSVRATSALEHGTHSAGPWVENDNRDDDPRRTSAETRQVTGDPRGEQHAEGEGAWGAIAAPGNAFREPARRKEGLL
jgi:hypothetical protein